MRVGLVHGFLSRRYLDFWRAYLEALGVEVVEAAPPPSDLPFCLPVQRLLAQVEALKEAGVDYLLLPDLQGGVESERGGGQCPWLLDLEAALLRRLSLGRTGRGAARTSPPARLGPLAPLAHLFLLLPFLLAVAFPLYALLHLARRFPASATSGLAEALGHALLVALPVAFLSVGMALPIAYLASRYPSAASRTLERLAYLAYAIPPLAYALAWIFFSLRTLPFLYGTLALLVLALALHFLTESLGPVRSALAQVPPRLEEAARTLGDTPTRAFFRVTFPLLWRGAAAGGSLAFIGAMKELPITLLLAPTGFSTLATRVFGYTQEAMFAEAAPFALLIVGLSAAFVGVLLWNERRF